MKLKKCLLTTEELKMVMAEKKAQEKSGRRLFKRGIPGLAKDMYKNWITWRLCDLILDLEKRRCEFGKTNASTK